MGLRKVQKINIFRNIITMTYVSINEYEAELFRCVNFFYGVDSPEAMQLIQGMGLTRFCNYPDRKHQFITIALPTENYALSELKKVISELSYSYLNNAKLVVENFSGELKKENLHVHILKHGIYSKTKIIRDLSKKFRVAPNFINIKKGTKEIDYMNRLDYINGEKVSELKKENCELDRVWRDQNGFSQIYNL